MWACFALIYFRSVGGHAGGACQLQHHRERVEALLQQAARGKRPVGESESRHSHPSRCVWDLQEECASEITTAAVPQANAPVT